MAKTKTPAKPLDKMEIIVKAEKLLQSWGFEAFDSIISLQGPSIILTVAGKKKMTKARRQALDEIGMKIF